METISIPKHKLVNILSDVERLIVDFEDISVDQDSIIKQRLSDIKAGKVKGKTEKELDAYLKKRGVKVD